MCRQSGDELDHDATSSSNGTGRKPGFLEEARLLERELRGVVHDHLSLAALETRQAGESLVRIVAMGVITACLMFSAWLALVSAVVLVLVRHSLVTAGSALMLVFAVHCVIAMLLVATIRRRSRHLLFPGTISRLEPESRTRPEADGSR